jgi:hypothetical protein
MNDQPSLLDNALRCISGVAVLIAFQLLMPRLPERVGYVAIGVLCATYLFEP